MRIVGFGGVKLPLTNQYQSQQLSLTPVVMYSTQDPFSQLTVGTYFNIEPIVFGSYLRTGGDQQDALIGLVGFEADRFSFAYSYDYTISDLENSVSGGSHEISVILRFGQNSARYRGPEVNMSCPKF